MLFRSGPNSDGLPRKAGLYKNSRFSTNISLYLGNELGFLGLSVEAQWELVCDLSNASWSSMQALQIFQSLYFTK